MREEMDDSLRDLGFEEWTADGDLAHWRVRGDRSDYAVSRDAGRTTGSSVRMHGKWSADWARVSIAQYARPAALMGRRVRLTGFVRTSEVVRGWAGLWLQVYGEGKLISADDMRDRGPAGTTDWTRCEIVLDVPGDASNIGYGAMLVGHGTAWADDLSLESVGVAGEGPPTTPFVDATAPPDELNERMVRQVFRMQFVDDPAIEDSFRAVRRDLFLPGVGLERVYSGEAIPTQTGPDGNPTSSSSEPGIMAIMLGQLAVRTGARVLEIGAGTGYNAAVLAVLAGERGSVTTVDVDEEIAARARANLTAAGFERVRVLAADGWTGAPDDAPFDRIEVTVGVWDLSRHWLDQLRDGGVLVAPLWLGPGVQASVAFRREGARMRSASVEACGFMRLRGPHAGPERYVRVNDTTSLSVQHLTEEQTRILSDLIAGEPRREEIEAPPAYWNVRFVLSEPHAVSLNDAAGLFDAEDRSAAFAGGSVLMAFGGEGAARRLREALGRAAGLPLSALDIEAVPAGIPFERGDGAFVVRRPNFTFAVHERAGGPNRR